MFKKIKKLFKYGFLGVCGYLLISLLISVIPYAHQNDVSEESIKSFQSFEMLSSNQGTDDRVVLIEEPSDTFNVRHELIKSAQTSIRMSYYIFHDGNCTDAMMGDLIQAADRGVEIKLSIDGKIKYMDPKVYKKLKGLNEHQRIEVKLYNPVNLINPLHWQSMLHDKYLIVDEQYALVGGNNIGDKYFAPSDYTRSITEDRDVLVKNHNNSPDSAVNAVTNYAKEFWKQDILKPVKSKAKHQPQQISLVEQAKHYKYQEPQLYQKTLDDYVASMITTNKVSLIHNPTHNGPKEPWIGYQLKELSKHAEDEIIIQTPYSTSNKQILAYMDEMKERGISLNLITNSTASTPNILAFSTYKHAKKKYLERGVNIFEYQSLTDSLHAKTMLIDDRFTVLGTFNMDDRSMYVSTEMMLVIDSEAFNNEVKQAVSVIKNQSLQCNPDLTYKKSDHVEEQPVSLFKKVVINVTSIFTRLFEFII